MKFIQIPVATAVAANHVAVAANPVAVAAITVAVAALAVAGLVPAPTPSVVPKPENWAVMLLGLAMLRLSMRRPSMRRRAPVSA